MPPPSSSENRNQRRPEAEPHQRVDDDAIGRRITSEPGENGVIDRDAEQREAGHQQTGDGARLKGDVEAAGQRFRRRLRGAHIGAHGHVHANEPGGAGQQGAEEEAEGHPPAKQNHKQHENAAAHIGDGGVLALQIGLRALGDGVGDFLHFLRAGIRGEQFLRGLYPVNNGQKSKDNG